MQLGVIALVATLASGDANLLVQVGDLLAGFKPSHAYTIADLRQAGRPYMDVVSGNGSVLKYRTEWEWAGSYHGHETVEQTSLAIDGQPAVVGSGLYYAAEQYADLSRTTLLGPGYRLTHDMRMHSGRIDEVAHFTGLPGGNFVEVFYGFLGTRSNMLTDWAAYSDTRTLLGSGHTIANDDALPPVKLPAGATSVAQYNPYNGTGVLTRWEVPAGIKSGPFIQDRAGDNKLYLPLDTVGSPAGFDFTIRQSMIFFSAPPETWKAVAAELGVGDFNGDGVFNNFDIGPFELALADPAAFRAAYPFVVAPAAIGDLNGNGLLDNFDIGLFEDRLASRGHVARSTPSAAASGAAQVPEPSTFLLGSLAALVLLARRRCSNSHA